MDNFAIKVTLPVGRHPVCRTGERSEIPFLLRYAVMLRDGSTCKLCGSRLHPRYMNLDHVIPWSAGGPDEGKNLRVLCEPCNRDRSNFRDGTEGRTQLPVTWWCTDCWANASQHESWHEDRGEHWANCWLLRIAAESGISGWAHAWLCEPHLDPEAPRILAYCAHCDAAGYTSRPM